MKIDIPPEALEAARRAFFDDKGMRGAILAALNAWPGMREIISVQLNMAPAIILPIQETSDE